MYTAVPSKYGIRYKKDARFVKKSDIPPDILIKLQVGMVDINEVEVKTETQKCVFCEVPTKQYRLLNLNRVYVCNDDYYDKTLGEVAKQVRIKDQPKWLQEYWQRPTPGFIVETSSMTNEGLAIEIKNLSVQIADLKFTLANLNTLYVTSDVYKLQLEQLQTQMNLIKDDVRSIRSSRWIQNTLSAILGTVLTLLVSYFVLNIGKH